MGNTDSKFSEGNTTPWLISFSKRVAVARFVFLVLNAGSVPNPSNFLVLVIKSEMLWPCGVKHSSNVHFCSFKIWGLTLCQQDFCESGIVLVFCSLRKSIFGLFNKNVIVSVPGLDQIFVAGLSSSVQDGCHRAWDCGRRIFLGVFW